MICQVGEHILWRMSVSFSGCKNENFPSQAILDTQPLYCSKDFQKSVLCLICLSNCSIRPVQKYNIYIYTHTPGKLSYTDWSYLCRKGKVLRFQDYANHIPQNASYLQLILLRPTQALIKQGPLLQDWNTKCIPRSQSLVSFVSRAAHQQTLFWWSLALPASVSPAPSNARACVSNWSALGALVLLWALTAVGCPLCCCGGGYDRTFGVFLLPSSAACFLPGLVGPWLRTHLRPQAPTPNHVHRGGLGHHGRRRRGGRQDEDRQSPHNPGVWGGDPGWGDAGTAGLCSRSGEGHKAPGQPSGMKTRMRFGNLWDGDNDSPADPWRLVKRGLDVVNQSVWGL